MRTASMPMYDMPEVREALDSLWTGLARNMKREGVPDVPVTIAHGEALHDLWTDPRLLLSQCCGYDILHPIRWKATAHRHAALRRTGLPRLRLFQRGRRRRKLRERRCLGHTRRGVRYQRLGIALRHERVTGPGGPVEPQRQILSDVKVSGAHTASLEMVRLHEADVTAIDCVTYAMLESYRPDILDGTQVLGHTYRAPGIPYVTHWDEHKDTVARIRTSVLQTFADSDFATARRTLYLKDIEMPPPAIYRRIAEAEEIATRNGYPELR